MISAIMTQMMGARMLFITENDIDKMVINLTSQR